MIKVFEDLDLSRVGQFQSVLEAAGIRTMLKNQYVSGVFGAIPMGKASPQIWILEDRDLERAQQLIRELEGGQAGDRGDWICPHCAAEVAATFSRCWRCQAGRPEPIA
jgi:hypothetical protein